MLPPGNTQFRVTVSCRYCTELQFAAASSPWQHPTGSRCRVRGMKGKLVFFFGMLLPIVSFPCLRETKTKTKRVGADHLWTEEDTDQFSFHINTHVRSSTALKRLSYAIVYLSNWKISICKRFATTSTSPAALFNDTSAALHLTLLSYVILFPHRRRALREARLL